MRVCYTFTVLSLCFTLFFCALSHTAYAKNRYNPYMQQKLPTPLHSDENKDILAALGGHPTTIQDEAGHRKHWREEIYPVVFGNKTAPGEVLVFLDYTSPESAVVWREVVKATALLNPQTSKVVVFGNSKEHYGTELLGGGIWIGYARPAKALEYFTYTLTAWNSAKTRHQQQGRQRRFVYDVDTSFDTGALPILPAYLETLQPTLSTEAQARILDGAYEAGNVNMFQAMTAAHYYNVPQLPAVVVNGRLLSNPTATTIVQAVK